MFVSLSKQEAEQRIYDDILIAAEGWLVDIKKVKNTLLFTLNEVLF